MPATTPAVARPITAVQSGRSRVANAATAIAEAYPPTLSATRRKKSP